MATHVPTPEAIAAECANLPPAVSDSHFHSVAVSEAGIDVGAVLSALDAAGGGPFLDVAITPLHCARQRELTGHIPRTYYSCGLHPSLTGAENRPDLLTRVATELASGLYDAVGETGLDWVRMYAPEAVQRDAFATHLKLAALHDLPVIVHNRGADEACSEMLAAAELPRGGIMHCFSSGPEWVERFVDLGMYISFAGNSTFRNAPELREAMRHVPAERLLLETDAPFLSPHPLRGRPNHPARVVHIAAVLAEERSLSLVDTLQLTSRNLTRLLERT